MARGALPGRKPGSDACFLKVFRDSVESFVHSLRVHFHPQQFFARSQIFDSDIHNNPRWSASRVK